MSSASFGFATGEDCGLEYRVKGDALEQSASVGADAIIDALVRDDGVHSTGGDGEQCTHYATVATQTSHAVGISEGSTTKTCHAVWKSEGVENVLDVVAPRCEFDTGYNEVPNRQVNDLEYSPTRLRQNKIRNQIVRLVQFHRICP